MEPRIFSFGFGTVSLVRDPRTRRRLALKAVSKRYLLSENQSLGPRRCQWLLREKAALEELSHPFIIRLHTTYEDADHVYLLLDLLQGGEVPSPRDL